jgi:hypothetical protein
MAYFFHFSSFTLFFFKNSGGCVCAWLAPLSPLLVPMSRQRVVHKIIVVQRINTFQIIYGFRTKNWGCTGISSTVPDFTVKTAKFCVMAPCYIVILTPKFQWKILPPSSGSYKAYSKEFVLLTVREYYML